MDQIKLLVKEVLYKIQDIPDVPFTPVRMSELAAARSSTLSMDCTYKSFSKESMTNDIDLRNHTDNHNNNDDEAAESTLSSSSTKIVEPSLHHIFPEVTEIRQSMPPLLKLNSLSIEDITTKHQGSLNSVSSLPNQSPLLQKAAGSPLQPKILMGKLALLRSRSEELHQNDPAAVAVHELVNVNEKYQDQVSHYIGRMYRRRMSRGSRSTDDDGTSSNYSGGSLRTPDSLLDGKSYFSLFVSPDSETYGESLGSTDDLSKDITDPADLLNATMYPGDATLMDFECEPDGDVSLDSQSTSDGTLRHSKFHSRSVEPVPQPSLLSKVETLCSSARKSLRRACSFTEKKVENTSVNKKTRNRDRCQSYSPEAFGSTENLMRELYVQNGTIFQVSKALAYCRSSKDITSAQYIEAEKILLVASCHKEAIQAALDTAEFGEKDHLSQGVNGTLDICNISYYLKGDMPMEYEAPKCFDEYFVIVITGSKTVLSSKVLVRDKNGEIKSDQRFRLEGLPTDFEVSVAVYAMNVRHTDGNDAKNHKKDRKSPCPSSKNFFHLSPHKSSRKNLLLDNVSTIKPSSFTLWGVCTIRCSDLEKTHFRMEQVPLCSSLERYFTASLTGDVKLTNRSCGFLTVGFEDKGHLIWNRRWCLLEGHLLKYWNYPSEEFSSKPLGLIDLARAMEKSSPADRSICPRPKSLCLLIKNREGLVLKYFLAADSLEDKQSWKEKINFVIGTLESWKCLCPQEKVTEV